jgi:hypothetical protein
MSLRKNNRPKCSQTHLLSKLMHVLEKSGPKFLATFVIFKQLIKVKNQPVDENSSNLVTLMLVKSAFLCTLNKLCLEQNMLFCFQTFTQEHVIQT